MYGKSLLRRRGESVKRSFAHCYETGGMRRTHLRGHENILKRQLIHVGAFNLSLIYGCCWVRASRGSGRTEEPKNQQGELLLRLILLLQCFNGPNRPELRIFDLLDVF
jgi:transposase